MSKKSIQLVAAFILAWLFCMMIATGVLTVLASFIALEFVTPYQTSFGRAALVGVGLWIAAVMLKSDAK